MCDRRNSSGAAGTVELAGWTNTWFYNFISSREPAGGSLRVFRLSIKGSLWDNKEDYNEMGGQKMYKVLIVDDEKYVISLIEKLIDWESLE